MSWNSAGSMFGRVILSRCEAGLEDPEAEHSRQADKDQYLLNNQQETRGILTILGNTKLMTRNSQKTFTNNQAYSRTHIVAGTPHNIDYNPTRKH